ncbi:MarR family winged helix-turn-helix transcriptional regulator [Aeromicrobium duanguangcaii]|uniref:MarR family transcriptional regulator n=1 Tax=Aeromicrobium duanguangcaii TaxID=2968086 RepID=A0ABY5KIA3_9ACTN|nr:MarR family transcriptional regulator [Aeromicrobium duanguangcaii]MCD9153336.1 MarR family transcriptional regulator [Aeromicrobium duanguangcaii]UUI69570.1 MarR family transcriptional regulator [Aeromicrobium duanguangcaii]
MASDAKSSDDRVNEELLDQLSLYGRRARGAVERIAPELSFAEYSLLGQVSAEDGVRAHDLARVFGLDKSTVSRQLAGLTRRGLIERDESRSVRVTPAGARLLRSTRAALLELLGDRIADWSPEERRTFADLMRRYNAADPESGGDHA